MQRKARANQPPQVGGKRLPSPQRKVQLQQELRKDAGEFSTNLWEDTYMYGGDATDIHIDFLHPGDVSYLHPIPYPVVTMQTYLPLTNEYTDIGTSFYKHIGDDIFEDAFVPDELPYEHPCNAYALNELLPHCK